MKTQIISLFAVASLLSIVTGCSNSEDATSPTSPAESNITQGSAVARTPVLGLEFWQYNGSVRQEVNAGVVTVSLATAGFQIRLPKIDLVKKNGEVTERGLQIAAWTDDAIFSLKDGAPVNDDSVFGAGKGTADDIGGSGRLFVSNEQFNYFSSERVIPYSASVDAVTIFQTSVRTAGGDIETTPLAQQKKDLFVAVFLDKNDNGSSDPGEYEYLKLHFETPE